MSKEIKTWRDPYDAGFSTCRPKSITIQPGFTVLVGCNGSGKSTLLHNIQEQLQAENIPVYYYDNANTKNLISEAIWNNQMYVAAMSATSSEGEQITLGLNVKVNELSMFIDKGKVINRHSRIAEAFGSKEQEITTNERWILLDAIDSGYSIDNIVDLKAFLASIADDAYKSGKVLYIVAAANSYELAAHEACMDATTGKYMQFDSYEEYKKFILKSGEKKARRDKRYENMCS